LVAKNVTMFVEQKEIAKWKSLYQYGDKTKIAEQYQALYQKASLSTVQGQISTLFKHGFCNDPLYPVIKKYYEKVEAKLKPVK
jgi:hypothetical protein